MCQCVQGVLHPADVELAFQAGAAAVIVSNHGGRQLDHTPAALDVLEAAVAAARGRGPVLMDGGIRRGSDVVKALALGASAVCLGRPVLYGLAKGGERGVRQVLGMLRKEVRLAMALVGAASVADLQRDLVRHVVDLPLRSRL